MWQDSHCVLGDLRLSLCLRRAGESKAGLEGLALLVKRIRLIAERNAASPSERLLDDLLRLLDASENAIDADEVQEVWLPCPAICALCTILSIKEVWFALHLVWSI